MTTRTTLWTAAGLVLAAVLLWMLLGEVLAPSDAPEGMLPEGESQDDRPPAMREAPASTMRTAEAPEGLTQAGGEEPSAPGAARAGATDIVARSQAFLGEANAWLTARRAAQAADDDAAEEAARIPWDAARKAMIERLRRDTAGATVFLQQLGAHEEPATAMQAARILPFLHGPGFDGVLMRSARDAGRPVLERRAAILGLTGRGLGAARIVGEVAGQAEDVTLRGEAVRALAGHLGDPYVTPQRASLRAAVVENLGHGDAGVRRAAVSTLGATRQPLDDATRTTLATLARDDADPQVRALAAQLLRR